jgi:tripartite ATP-independent transporter DctM subunit
MTILMILTFFVQMIIGVPLFIALLVTACMGFICIGDPGLFRLMVQQFFGGLDIFSLMAIPFFIFAGVLMNASGLTDRLLLVSRALVGHFKGGLGYVNVVASIIFAGVNGSAAADTSALGGILIPAMGKEGYPRAYAAGLTAGSSLIGPIIPPSIFMILYGTMTNTSIGGLFVAGIIPGLILGLAFMAMNAYFAVCRGFPQMQEAFSLSDLIRAGTQGLVALIAPLIIIGGIVLGVMTPTESGAVAVLYVALAGFFWTRELNLRKFWTAVTETCRLTSVIFLIIGAAAIIGWLLSYQRVPQRFAQAVLHFSHSQVLVMIVLSLITFVIGMFMEEVATLVLLTPVFTPIATAAGIDPLHFGIVIILNITIALITPPMGACVYIASAVGQVPLGDLFKNIWPFVLVAMGVVLAIIVFPPLTVSLPRLLGL